MAVATFIATFPNVNEIIQHYYACEAFMHFIFFSAFIATFPNVSARDEALLTTNTLKKR